MLSKIKNVIRILAQINLKTWRGRKQFSARDLICFSSRVFAFFISVVIPACFLLLSLTLWPKETYERAYMSVYTFRSESAVGSQAGVEAEMITELFSGWMIGSCLFQFFLKPRPICWGSVTSTVDLSVHISHQLGVSHRHSHWPVWPAQFLSWSFLYPAGSGLCQLDSTK